MKPKTLLAQVTAATNAAAPLFSIRTPDPTRTMAQLNAGPWADRAQLSWDIVAGVRGLNDAGTTLARAVLGEPELATNLVEVLDKFRAADRARGLVLYLLNAGRFLGRGLVSQEAAACVQGFWNLRDAFKARDAACVAIGVDVSLPVELAQDTLQLEQPMPDDAELATIVSEQFENARLMGASELATPDAETLRRAVASLRGLAPFPAEGAVAENLYTSGLDLGGLSDRRRSIVNATDGLTFWEGGETFADLGGLSQFRAYIGRVLASARRPGLVLFWDEVEKSFAGASEGARDGGTSKGSLQAWLTWLNDRNAIGCLLLGHPGCGKSAVAKAVGTEGGIPTIACDLGALRGGIVGESEARTRAAQKTLDSIAGDARVLVLATCNSIQSLPTELRRRFKRGTWFFDLPSAQERATILAIYLKRYALDASQDMPDTTDWTGAEVANVCELASDLSISIAEASEYIVPICVSDGEKIASLRDAAAGRYLNAAAPKAYQKPAMVSASQGRTVRLQDARS